MGPAESMRRKSAAPASGRALRFLPLVVLWILIGIELAAMLALCDGRLMYTLDDPYIHLALAENLLGGHFGLNASEASAPSSSLLWPFLLAPFTKLSVVEWVPLLLNMLAATLTLALIGRTLHDWFAPAENRRLQVALAILTIFAIPATNLVGLVFTGMEHSLQVLLAVLLVRELVAAVRGASGRRALAFAIVVGPWVRYENAALSAAALLCLFWNGERRRALFLGGVMATGLVAYSAFLLSQGLHFLPSSVLAKSAAADTQGGLKPVLYGLYHNISSTPGVLMSLGVIALLAAGTRAARALPERRFALCIAGALALHLVVGRFGWYGRYEIYAWSAGLLACLFIWRDNFRAWLLSQSVPITTAIALCVVVIGAREYVIILTNNAFAAQNVYRQQYQMHRLVTEVIDEPVAVNDLGWVAFRNEHYVLDLWGLASIQALEARRANKDSAWISPLAAEHGVRCALIYEDWFPDLPANWRRVGELHMAGPRITPAKDVVAIYALDAEREVELRTSLPRFAETLPRGATLVLD